jgi:hypothetical protein
MFRANSPIQQLAAINGLNQQFLGQQQQVGNLLLPQFQSIVNNPGLSPADKAVVTGQSQGALSSAFRFAGVPHIDEIQTDTPHGSGTSKVYPANVTFPGMNARICRWNE